MTEEAGFQGLKTDVGTNSATFTVASDFDYEAKLNEIVKGGNTHVKGWSKQEAEADDDSDKPADGEMTSVSIKLPGMT